MEKKFGSGLRHNRTIDMFCVMGTIQLITWPVLTLGRAARGILGDTGLENVRDLNCRPRYKYHVKSPKDVSGNSQFFSKYIKNIWLHFINSTVKTPKISLSPEMATQISGNDVLYTAYNKTLNNFS